MARPYSLDLRERVVAAVASGETCRAVSDRFGVAVSTVVKWSQRVRLTGSAAPGQMGGHKKHILAPHRDWLAERVSRESHVTLHRLRGELAERGITVSHDTIWRFLRLEGLRFKKNRAGVGEGPG